MQINSEEDIKSRIIIPYLESLGFTKEELRLEKSFSLKLGRFTFRTDTLKQCSRAQPRLDILVTENGKNLFIVEAKSDSSKLTDDDRDQAISYARLVDPMAPFTLLISGNDFKIFKTIDKEEITKDFDFNGYKLPGNLNLEYEEAFNFFINYSPENLNIFSKKQIEDGTRTIVGSKVDRNKKFIPELYVYRDDLRKNFETFLKSDKSAFAIVGESGSGKTCEMCGLAFHHQNSHPVLFYRGIELGVCRTFRGHLNC